MRVLEIIGTVGPDGKITLQLPSDIPAGRHRMVLSIDESTPEPSQSWQEKMMRFYQSQDAAGAELDEVVDEWAEETLFA